MRSPSLSSATTDFEDLGETLPAPDVAVVPLQVDELSIHQSTAEKSIAPKSMSPQQSQVSQDPNITYREHDTYYRMQRVVVSFFSDSIGLALTISAGAGHAVPNSSLRLG